jgi:hypothetical protein
VALERVSDNILHLAQAISQFFTRARGYAKPRLVPMKRNVCRERC